MGDRWRVVGAMFAHGGVAARWQARHMYQLGDQCGRDAKRSRKRGVLALGHVLFAVVMAPAFFDRQSWMGKNVGATEAEDQEHFGRSRRRSPRRRRGARRVLRRRALRLLRMEGTCLSMVFWRGFFPWARIFAPDDGRLCEGRVFRRLQHFWRGGARPVELKVLSGERWWRRLAGNGIGRQWIEEGFVGRLGAATSIERSVLSD